MLQGSRSAPLFFRLHPSGAAPSADRAAPICGNPPHPFRKWFRRQRAVRQQARRGYRTINNYRQTFRFFRCLCLQRKNRRKPTQKASKQQQKLKKGCKVFCYDSFFSHLKRIIAQNGAIFKLFGENYARNMKKSGAAHGSPAE